MVPLCNSATWSKHDRNRSTCMSWSHKVLKIMSPEVQELLTLEAPALELAPLPHGLLVDALTQVNPIELSVS